MSDQPFDLSPYMTALEVQAALGCSPRAVWRSIQRAGGREGICIKILNRTLIRKDKLDLLKAHYYPYYSEAHQANVKAWGAKGGTIRAARIFSRGTSGTAVAGPKGRRRSPAR